MGVLMRCSVVRLLWSDASPRAFWESREQRNHGFVLFFLLCVGWSGASLLMLTESGPHPSLGAASLLASVALTAAATFALRGRSLASHRQS